MATASQYQRLISELYADDFSGGDVAHHSLKSLLLALKQYNTATDANLTVNYAQDILSKVQKFFPGTDNATLEILKPLQALADKLAQS